MIFRPHVPRLARVQELCDMDSIVRSNSEKFEKNGGSWTVESNRIFVKWETSTYRSNFAVSGLSIF